MTHLKNGENLVLQIAHDTLIYTDKELVKHFNLESAKVFRKCADRIEQVYKRIENESKKKTE